MISPQVLKEGVTVSTLTYKSAALMDSGKHSCKVGDTASNTAIITIVEVVTREEDVKAKEGEDVTLSWCFMVRQK